MTPLASKIPRLGAAFLGCLALLSLGPRTLGASLNDPEIDAYNVRVGTQTFAPRYGFTAETRLIETAEVIRGMGSDVIKLYLGRNTRGQYGIARPTLITSLKALAEQEGSYRRVFDMPFRHYLAWAYSLSSNGEASWKDGFSTSEAVAEYEEIHALARYFLTNYNNSGKSFYLGHWEGDWHLLNGYDASVNPSAEAIRGMIDWLNTRQKAVDEAVQQTPHTNVFVYHYTEANRVRDAMVNGPTNNQRVVNCVLPLVTNIDCVSWSAYDGMNLRAEELHTTLNFIKSSLPTNKTGRVAGNRVIVGEYGWGGSLAGALQEEPTRAFMQRSLSWGARFILFWQVYDNEQRAYWLVDSNNTETACYFLHERFINRARLLTARFKEAHGRTPTESEFCTLTSPLLAEPLEAATNIVLTHLLPPSLTATSAVVSACVAQEVYGDEQAAVRVFWGLEDGGTNSHGWHQSATLGLNTNFNPVPFPATLRKLQPGTKYYYRFMADNARGQQWAPSSGQLTTDGVSQ